MLSDRTNRALLDIRDNIMLAREFVAGISFETFKKDRMRFYAVMRALEIISEAVRRLSPELRERHSALPWRAIMGVGNIYRHDYDNVVEDYVWQTVQHSLEPLMLAVQHEIAQLDAEAQ